MKSTWIAVAMLAAVTSSNANTLVGQTLKFERLYPNLLTQQEPFQVREVSAGTQDSISWGSVFGNVYGSMNPEANSIEYTAVRATSFVSSGSIFDGFRITGFGNNISFAAVVSNTTGLNLELSYTADSLTIDLGGVQSFPGSFSVSVTTVPEPATYALLVSGLLLIQLRRARQYRG
jgi:hypothetical protein